MRKARDWGGSRTSEVVAGGFDDKPKVGWRDVPRVWRAKASLGRRRCAPWHSIIAARRPLALSRKRSLGSYAAAGRLQQRPSLFGGGIIKRHWFRYFQPRGANLPPVVVRLPDGTQTSIAAMEAPHRVDEQIQSWDCAFKDLMTSDYVVGQVWGRVSSIAAA